MHHLVGIEEVRVMLNVGTRQRADQITRLDGFPPPTAELHGRFRVWESADVDKWIKENRPTSPNA